MSNFGFRTFEVKPDEADMGFRVSALGSCRLLRSLSLSLPCFWAMILLFSFDSAEAHSAPSGTVTVGTQSLSTTSNPSANHTDFQRSMFFRDLGLGLEPAPHWNPNKQRRPETIPRTHRHNLPTPSPGKSTYPCIPSACSTTLRTPIQPPKKNPCPHLKLPKP